MRPHSGPLEKLALIEEAFRELVGDATVAVESADLQCTSLCRLWAGMGHIYKVTWMSPKHKSQSLIFKHVVPPPVNRQSFGDRRKAKSYQVEANFYQHVAKTLVEQYDAAIPRPLGIESNMQSGEIFICMSLLSGGRLHENDPNHLRAVMDWMARFHAAFWGRDKIDAAVQDFGLNAQGSYWYLDTRPDEFDQMPRRGWEGRLRLAARAIDACLKRDPMQCLIHGDPKDANIMVPLGSGSGPRVAMYDFQYCGKASPTKDLAYFFCSSTNLESAEEQDLVQFYHQRLSEYLVKSSNQNIPTLEHLQLSLEVAYADYCRFMAGWGYWGDDIQSRTRRFMDRLDGGRALKSEDAYTRALEEHFW